jgi:hypothetical protein
MSAKILSFVYREHNTDVDRNVHDALRPGGAVLLNILVEPLLRPIVSRWARERLTRGEDTNA